MPGETALGADKISEAFHDAAEADDVKAIVFRIDSPGGSPEASETIRRALLEAQKKGKPVIVSMGEVAASGGYWVAMNADRIIAEPATLTGSIGVFAGKFTVGGLTQKIGVNLETLKTTDSAGMWSMTDEFTPPQLARVNALLDNTYQAFKKNVSDARKIPIEKMPDIAKGRVWTGEQALPIGLVDALGGYRQALDAVREKLKLGKDAPLALEPYPPPETPYDRVLKFMKNFGVDSAAFIPFLSNLQKIESALGLLGDAPTGMKPVELLAPQAVPGIVR
jgi:protease-4